MNPDPSKQQLQPAKPTDLEALVSLGHQLLQQNQRKLEIQAERDKADNQLETKLIDRDERQFNKVFWLISAIAAVILLLAAILFLRGETETAKTLLSHAVLVILSLLSAPTLGKIFKSSNNQK
jgi:DNA-binding NtrC family response regulator